MRDERLRELERAAVAGDPGAALEHARLRARLGLPSPADLRVGEPFPCGLPAPIRARRAQGVLAGEGGPPRFRVFEEPAAWWRSRTLRVDAGGDPDERLELLFEPEVRSLAAQEEAHQRWLRPVKRGPREPWRVAAAGEGQVVSYAVDDRRCGRYLVHGLLHPERGTLWWRDPWVRLDLSGVWLGAPPRAAGGGWALWLGDEAHLELSRALRGLLGLDLRATARLRKRLGGPCLTGQRLTLALLAELLRGARGLPAEALWLSVLPPDLLEVGPPRQELWDALGERAGDLPQLGRHRGWPEGG